MFDQDVRRRYERSLSNLGKALKIADQSVLYDNSGIGPRLVVEMRSGIVVTDAILDVQWAQPFSRNTS
jgi:predicted ABC-type ATPase